jgi:hypothetical protein
MGHIQRMKFIHKIVSISSNLRLKIL